jgi:hypothetical protein
MFLFTEFLQKLAIINSVVKSYEVTNIEINDELDGKSNVEFEVEKNMNFVVESNE